MYAWSHSAPTEESMLKWMNDELGWSLNKLKLGLYLEDKDTGLLTCQDKTGERAFGPLPTLSDDFRLTFYVFNTELSKTIFRGDIPTAVDIRN